MYCNRCGTFMPDTAEFCPNCGNRVQRTQQISVREAPAKGSKNSVLIGAIIAVAVVVVVCIICFTIVMKGNQDAQLAAVQSAVTAQDEQNSTAADDGRNVNGTSADTGNTSGSTDSNTAAQDKADTSSGTDNSTNVTNNYYYYGTGAVRDNDYYTKSVSSGYLWPTDTQYISFSDLSGLNQDTVAAIRNEIYARHGYAFTTTRWQDYFSAKTWYNRDSTCTESTINGRLSSLERTNISTIVSYEESKGWR